MSSFVSMKGTKQGQILEARFRFHKSNRQRKTFDNMHLSLNPVSTHQATQELSQRLQILSASTCPNGLKTGAVLGAASRREISRVETILSQ